MEPAPEAWLVAIVFFALLTGFSSAMVVSARRSNVAKVRLLAEEGDPGAKEAARLLATDGGLAYPLSVLRLLAIAGSAVATVGLASSFALWPWPLVWGVPAFLLIILSYSLGEEIACRRPEAVFVTLHSIASAATLIMKPLSWPATAFSAAVAGLLSIRSTAPSHDGEQEIRLLVDAVEESSTLEEDEREMIQGIVGMGAKTAREVMSPRIDVVAVAADTSLSQVLGMILETGHSRIPVYEETVDNIVGIVHAKDLLRHLKEPAPERDARSLCRPAYFVPETKKIDELLRELQTKKVHMAIVLDEYGGTAGIITIEDLLEEIVGEIQDEYDVEEPSMEQLGPGEAVFDGRVSLHEVNEMLGVNLEEPECDTLGGLLYARLGRVPAPGDQISAEGCTLSVLSTAGKRVRKVRVIADKPVEQ